MSCLGTSLHLHHSLGRGLISAIFSGIQFVQIVKCLAGNDVLAQMQFYGEVAVRIGAMELSNKKISQADNNISNFNRPTHDGFRSVYNHLIEY